jgi:predicted membrane channel-forming protein YqfA (hemolysin III family)
MQIDLEPHEYRSNRSRRNGLVHLGMALLAIAALVYFWVNRADLTTETLFGVVAMFGGCAGAGLIVFFNQFRGV